MKQKDDLIYATGRVVADRPGRLYIVELDGSGARVLAYMGGNLVRHHIRLIIDDHVDLECSPTSFDRWRITYRRKD